MVKVVQNISLNLTLSIPPSKPNCHFGLWVAMMTPVEIDLKSLLTWKTFFLEIVKNTKKKNQTCSNCSFQLTNILSCLLQNEQRNYSA